MSKKNLTMWFDDKGNLLSRAADYLKKRAHAQSKEGENFKDSMKFIHIYDGGQSAGRVWFESENSKSKYSMFVDDFDRVIRSNAFINNHVEGTFKFVKRGQAQGIALILENEPPEIKLDVS